MALFAGLCISLALRLATFASWFLLFPLGVWAFLTGGLLPSLGRPYRGYCVPHMRDASGVGTLTTRGEVRCPHMQRHRLHAFVKGFWSLHCSPDITVFVIHVPMTSSYAASSRVHSRSPVRSSREGGSTLWLSFPLGITPGFTPSRCRERMQELVTGLDTSLGECFFCSPLTICVLRIARCPRRTSRVAA